MLTLLDSIDLNPTFVIPAQAGIHLLTYLRKAS